MKYKLFLLSAACLAASCITIRINRDLLEVRTNEFEVGAGSELNFENTSGDLEVREWELNFVRIESSIYGDSSSGIPTDLNIIFEDQDDQLSVVTDFPSGISFYSVNFLVMIPDSMGYTVNYKTTNGEALIVGGVTASAESTNGDIFIEAIACHSLKTTNGDITAVLPGQNQAMLIQATNGDVTVEIPDIIGFQAETVNGSIVVGDIEMDDEVFVEGEWNAGIETTNGDIHIVRTGVY